MYAFCRSRAAINIMTTSRETIAFLMDQLSGLAGVTHLRMFGEYCVYVYGKPVGFVVNDQLHLKMTYAGRDMASEVDEGFPYPNAKPHLLITADLWEDHDWLADLVRTTAKELD